MAVQKIILEHQIGEVYSTICALDACGSGGDYLSEPQFERYVGFLKKRLGVKGERRAARGVAKGGNAGKAVPGKKINSAIKKAGKPLTIEEIAKAKNLPMEVVREYLTKGEGAIRYEKVGDAYGTKK
jgi:hypothetical protein